MRIFAIRDENQTVKKDLAYLLYYEGEDKFYIELPDDVDEWDIPLILDVFAKEKITTVNSYWSRIWVQQRIIPPDRQNIAMILRDNHLERYDDFSMLMLAMGRCAQDDYYLSELSENDVPQNISERFSRKIEDVLPLDDYCLLVFFRDGTVKKCDIKEYMTDRQGFAVILNNPEYFDGLQIMTGGYGVSWDVNLSIPDFELYSIGTVVPLTAADFRSFAVQRVVNVAEAAEMLGCTRQNIDYLTKQGKLHPIKKSEKNTLYLKSEILKRNW